MPNRLAAETSPYLLQHADNPVDWLPWGEEALALAREQNKPILLSIGYSSCHWCHVMAHESFEDPVVAAEMNQHFINIKVDREERPDLDQIYQAAHQLIAGRSGGWPLTVFLSPEQVPFFAGTYFPKEPRYQLPGFTELLSRVAHWYQEHQAEVAAQSAGLITALDGATAAPAPIDRTALDGAARQLAQQFDRVHGGFGKAPKFPRPTEMEFALRYRGPDGAPPVGEMALFTLTNMAAGGLVDQLGGGFYRYSVDDHWAIPHFEKMLYDNGPLLGLYADAWRLTGNPRFKVVCEQTVAWLQREMTAPGGGFYSALDADSEHEEGKFYVWTPDAVRALLTPEEYALLAPHYGLDQPANFEHRHWHFVIAQELGELAQRLGIEADTAEQALTSARAKLFAARELRVRPGRDDKQLTSWNALMIKGLAHAGRVLQRPDWVAAAQHAADFIRAHLYREGRLLASYKDGQAKLNGYLDDYAFLLDALLELLQAEYRAADLAWTQELADTLLAQFEDARHGGFFFTSHDHEKLLHRPKPAFDNATPSGNGVAAFALQRLGHLLGETRYLQASERALTFFMGQVIQYPSAHPSLLATIEEQLDPPLIVVLRGPAADFAPWRGALARPMPRALIMFLPNGLSGVPAALAKPESATVNAWACAGVKCLPPIDQPATLGALVKDMRLR